MARPQRATQSEPAKEAEESGAPTHEARGGVDLPLIVDAYQALRQEHEEPGA